MRGAETLPLLLWCETCGSAFSEGVAFVCRERGCVRLTCPECFLKTAPGLRLIPGGGAKVMQGGPR